MPSHCESCGAPAPAPGEVCSWCSTPSSVRAPRRCVGCGTLTDAPAGLCAACLQNLREPPPQPPPVVAPPPRPAPPASSPCRICGRLTAGPNILCPKCARPPRERWWGAIEAQVSAHAERHPLPWKLLSLTIFGGPVVLALGFAYGGWFQEPERPEVEPPFDYRYYALAAPAPKTDPEVGLAAALKRGDVVVLTNERAAGHRSEPVLVFPTRAALEQAGKATADRHRSDLWEATAAALEVPRGTRARIVNLWPQQLFAEVHFLDGPLKDQTGWLPTVQLRR